MIKRIQLGVIAAITSLLMACGGGGTEDDIDKYVGTWTTCIDLEYQGIHSKYTLNITKLQSTRGYISGKIENYYSDGSCKQQIGVYADAGTDPFNIVGQGTVQGQSVDRIIFDRGNIKDVLWTSGNQLKMGFSGNDSEGYPTILSAPFIKQ